MRASRRPARNPVGLVVLALLLPGGLLAACGSTPTHHQFGVTIEPKSRAGQLPLPPTGRLPTLGPRGFNPSEANGVQLNVLSGLRNDTPIFNGDFADPFVLRTSEALFLYASNTTASPYAPAAHIPEIEMAQPPDFRGRLHG